MTPRAARNSLFTLAVGWVAGCAPVSAPLGFRPPEPLGVDWHARATPPAAKSRLDSPGSDAIVQAQAREPAPGEPNASAPPAHVDALVRVAIERNPRLAKAQFTINAAQGRHVQAGLYPNPEFSFTADELGDRTGPGGILSPRVTQTIVTGKKLSLAQAIIAAEVDQATLGLMAERYAVIGAVRAAFCDVYALERRIEMLDKLVQLANDAVENGKLLLENKQIARLDLVQLEVEREKFRADAEATKRELPGARRALAAVIGDARMDLGSLEGFPFENVPAYDLDQTREVVLATHPEARAARVGVDRAQATVRRARAEPIPNVTFYTGYVRQFQNQSHDLSLGMSAPVPIWNRNQGNIRAAQAEFGVAVQEVARVENDLADRVATAVRTLASARRRAEAYRTAILPRAEETYDLSLKAFKGGQFEYLRVIQAQRSVAEARLAYNAALSQAWKAAAELSGFLLEESWPGPPPGPSAGPATRPVVPDPKLLPAKP